MKERTKRALINLMIITDEHNLLIDCDEKPKDYEDKKKKCYYELIAFIKKYGDKYKMKRYYKTLHEAKKVLKFFGNGYDIYDLGKNRKARRFFIGTNFEWLNL
jgi:hypothetical protein